MVDISTQARIAIYSLQPQDQKRVNQLISQLEGFPALEHVLQQASRLQGFDDLYLVRVTPKLRLIFRYADNHREVVDVVSHDRLERMYRYAH
jgi:mRNA-degrading endonuclease RelE of RelBE toxin-antitoxin system